MVVAAGASAWAAKPGKRQAHQQRGQQQARGGDDQREQRRAGGHGGGRFPGLLARAALEQAGEDRHEDAAHGVGADQAAQEAGDGQGGGEYIDGTAGAEHGGGGHGAPEVGQAGGQRRARVRWGAGEAVPVGPAALFQVALEDIVPALDLQAVVGAQRDPVAHLVAIEPDAPLLHPQHGRERLALHQADGEAGRRAEVLQRHVGQERVAHRGGRERQLQVLLLADHLQVERLDLAFPRGAFLADDPFHGVQDDGGAVGLFQVQQVLAHGGQLPGGGDELLDGPDQRVGRQEYFVPAPPAADLLVEDAGAARLFDLAGIEDLVVGRQVDLGDQDGRQPHGGDLLDGAGAGARDHQVGDGVDPGDVVEVFPHQQPALDLRREALALQVAHRVVVGLVAGMVGLAGGHDDEQVGDGEQPRHGLHGGTVDGPRPHAAAAYEQDAAARGDIQLLAAAFAAGGADRLAQRVAGQDHLGGRKKGGAGREGDADLGGEAGDEQVEAAGDGVLLVDEHPLLEQCRRQQHRRGRVAAAADDDVGLEAPQDEEAFHRPQEDGGQRHDAPQALDALRQAAGGDGDELHGLRQGGDDRGLAALARADVEELGVGISLFQGLVDGDIGIDMAAGAAAGKEKSVFLH